MSDDIIKRLERERDEWREACLAHGEKAERAERALADAVAAEREACWLIAHEMESSKLLSKIEQYRAGFIADAIRARGNPQPEHDRPGPSSTAFDDQFTADWRE